MKKVTKFLSIICLFMAFTLNFSNVNARASEDNGPVVQLCYTNYRFDGYATYAEGCVKVKNWSSDKKVTIHYWTDSRGGMFGWQACDANYVKTDCDGYEIWSFKVPYATYGSVYSKVLFAVKCEMNGQTYWDNNNGNNYCASRDKNTYGKNKIALIDSSSKNTSNVSNSITGFSGTIGLLNMDYNKDVIIKYTTDNWQSYKEQNAAYVRSSGDGTTEVWNFNVTLDQPSNNVKYCILNRASGQEYWDNNFESNYEIIN